MDGARLMCSGKILKTRRRTLSQYGERIKTGRARKGGTVGEGEKPNHITGRKVFPTNKGVSIIGGSENSKI